MSIKVAIVEDDKSYSNILRKIIDGNSPTMNCLGQYYSGREALKYLPTSQVNVVMLDIQLQDYMGTEILKILKPQMQNAKFVICTTYQDDETVFNALKYGACGYLTKDEGMEKISHSIIEANDGGAPMSKVIAQKVLQFFQQKNTVENDLENLSKTEIRVIELLSKGLLYKEIADKCCVSIDTIKKHIGHIYRKLHVANKIEAVNKFNQIKR